MNAQEQLLTHAAFVRNLARRMVQDEDRAEDLVQDTWVAALEHPPRYQKSIQAWLGTILTNFVRRSGRSEVRVRKREKSAARPLATPSSTEVLERETMIRSVVRAVFDLDERYRSVIILRYYDDLAPREIAQKLGLPVETVRTRQKRAIQLLRGSLDEEYGNRAAWLPVLVATAKLDPDPTEGQAAPGGRGPSDVLDRAPASSSRSALVVPAAVGVFAVAALLVLWLASRSSDDPGPDPAVVAGQEALVAHRESPGPRSEDDGATASSPSPAPDVEAARPPVSPSPPASRGSLLLRVFFADGTPAARVRLELSQRSMDLARGHRMIHETGPDGELRIPDLEPGRRRIMVDRAMISTKVMIHPGEETELDVELRRGLTVTGRVLDPEGVPVSGAEILFCRLYRFHDSGVVLARTGPGGEFTVRELSCPGVLGARAPGFAPSRMVRIPEKAEGHLEMDLELPGRGGSLTGQVLSATGDEVSRPEVLVEPWPGVETTSLRFQDRLPPPFRVVGDGSGRFTLDGLPSGEAALLVRAAGHAPRCETVDIIEGEAVQVTVPLDEGATVIGRVLDGTDRPIEGIEIVARCDALADLAPPWHARSDGSGAFLLPHLPSGPLRLQASLTSEHRKLETVEVPADGAVRVDFVFDTAHRIVGRLVDSAGSPLDGWKIEAVSPTERLMSHSLQGRDDAFRTVVRTDRDGRFTVTGCPARPHQIHVFEPDHVLGYPIVIEREVLPDAGEILLRTPAGRANAARFLGTIVREDGGALGKVTFLLKPLDEPWCLAFAYSVPGNELRTHPMTSGRYRLALSTDRAGSWILGDYDLGEAQDLDIGSVKIRPAGRVRASFRDAEDRPVAIERVWVAGATGSRTVVLVAAEGGYSSPILPPGRYVLTFSGTSIADGTREIEILPGETTEVSVEVKPGSPVRLLFDEPEGNRWSRTLDLVVRDAGDQLLWKRDLRRSGHGGFELRCGLPPGRVRLEARTDAGLAGGLEAEIGEDRDPADEQEISLRLR